MTVEVTTPPFPFDPNGPPVATFFEAGGNIPGGLPYTSWAAELRKQRFEVSKAKDNPDANCMFTARRKMRRDYRRGRFAKTPGRAEFGIVEKSSIELDRFQNFGKNIHSRVIESSRARAVKKAGRSDKQPKATLVYV